MSSSGPEGPGPADTPQTSPPGHEHEAPPRRRRIPRFVLIAALLGASYLLFPALPRDHEVVLKLDSPETVVGLEVEWSQHDGSGEEPLRRASWRFEQGKAPSSITSNVRVPNG